MRQILIRSVIAVGTVLALWVVADFLVKRGFLGDERGAGEVIGGAVPAATIIAREQAQARSRPAFANKQVLFGDLHVHSTYSTDAFLWALPVLQGQGYHPVAEACDYARYCSSVDFWSITDHAEASTPERWLRTKQSVRQCQAKSDSAANPDMVSFLGFEWTQVGETPETHYGHKNVIFEHLDDDRLPARTIAASGIPVMVLRENFPSFGLALPLLDLKNAKTYLDFNKFLIRSREVPFCDPDKASGELPESCFELAQTPGDLARKLIDEQQLDPLIIPHGNSWGFYTPAGARWNKQLRRENRPETQPLIEVYSGHGNAEEFRDYRAAYLPGERAEGAPLCPDKTDHYTPSCQRLGDIIIERCLADGDDAKACDARASEAREVAAEAGTFYHVLIGGETSADWLDSGQCTNCYLPAFGHRPLTSVQAGLATRSFAENEAQPARFNWGFIGSSDNHRSRPGTGYKEVDRLLTTESGGPRSKAWRERISVGGQLGTPNDAYIHQRDRAEVLRNATFALAESERQSGFWLTGGLAAVHTKGRSREAIWNALQRRETYATSGLRMLLWFDYVDHRGEQWPMGATVKGSRLGQFRVRAVGSFKQKPGCPSESVAALGEAGVERLCGGECYNPTDERHLIQRIEIVRIRPQSYEGEPLRDLIEDPWIRHECPADRAGCDFEFKDPAFSQQRQDYTYYARAIQEPMPTINADPLQCEVDEAGACIKVNLCYGDYRSQGKACTSIEDARAWSSPIYFNDSRP